MASETKEPKSYKVELEGEHKQKLDVDDIRHRFKSSSQGGGLASLISSRSSAKEEATEEKEEEAEESESKDGEEKIEVETKGESQEDRKIKVTIDDPAPKKDDKEEGGEEEVEEEKPDPKQARVRKILGVPEKPKAKKRPTPKSASEFSTPPAINVKEVAETAATAAVKAISQTKEKEEKTDDGEWPSSLKEEVPVLDAVVKANPVKYKGLKQQFREFEAAERKYKTEWKKENSDKAWNPDDAEHADFYKDNWPDIPDADLNAAEQAVEAAKIDEVVEKKVAERLTPIQRREQERERKEAEARFEKEIDEDRREFVVGVAEAVGAEIPKDYKAKDIQEFTEKLPIHSRVIEAAMVGPVTIMETYRAVMDRVVAFNPKNPAHFELMRQIEELQANIEELPPAAKTKGGRKFLRMEQYAALPEESRDSYWTIGANHMRDWLVGAAIDQASKEMERIRPHLKEESLVRSSSRKARDNGESQAIKSHIVESGKQGPERGGVGIGKRQEPAKTTGGLQGFLRGIGVS